MAADPDPTDIAAMREEGDLLPYLISLTGRSASKPKPAPAEDEAPPYVIPYPGAWPIGTAASGPTPNCPCGNCASHPDTLLPGV